MNTIQAPNPLVEIYLEGRSDFSFSRKSCNYVYQLLRLLEASRFALIYMYSMLECFKVKNTVRRISNFLVGLFVGLLLESL